MPAQQSAITTLPSVDALLREKKTAGLIEQYGRQTVVDLLRTQIKTLREELLDSTANEATGGNTTRQQYATALLDQTNELLDRRFAPSLKPVLNLSGIILHTNLGRAPYPQEAIDAMTSIADSACNLEFELNSGKRGRRDDHVRDWICQLTGAESATTVNNNAAALLLALNTVAHQQKVVVSRGELIEIGGSFRLPAIMQSAGCKLREVGTTNRTHLHDYRNAITGKTAALLKVHTSNYQVQGFSKTVSAIELAALLAEQKGKSKPVLIDDLGSGSLVDLTAFGLPPERTAAQALQDGADLITFSGDKLLGGPQCGIIAGREDLIDAIERNPMKRAMRLDKITLAALEAVLKLYSTPKQLANKLPALMMLRRSEAEIQISAEQLQQRLRSWLPPHFDLQIKSCQSQIGSGALPTKTLPSQAVVISANTPSTEDAESVTQLSTRLRLLPKPIVGRLSREALWLDCRALTDISQLRLA